MANSRAPPPKRYDYAEIPMKSTVDHDRDAKEIHDYASRPIIKIDVNPKVELQPRHWMQYSLYPTHPASSFADATPDHFKSNKLSSNSANKEQSS